MTFDIATLEPLAKSIAGLALPTLSTILSDAAPFPLNLLAAPALEAVAGALGIDAAAPNAATQAAAAIAADPAAAKAKLAPVEEQHAALAAKAQAQLAMQLADVQSARATELALAQSGSPLQWGPVAISVVIVLGYAVACVWPLPTGAQNAGMYETVKLLAVMVASFWLGSSSGSEGKTRTLSTIATAAVRKR